MEKILLEYGVLGAWVIFSIVRERFLIKRMDANALRFDLERSNWNEERTRMVRILDGQLKGKPFDKSQMYWEK